MHYSLELINRLKKIIVCTKPFGSNLCWKNLFNSFYFLLVTAPTLMKLAGRLPPQGEPKDPNRSVWWRFYRRGGYGITASTSKNIPKWDVEGGVGFTGGEEDLPFMVPVTMRFSRLWKTTQGFLKGWYQYSDVDDTSVNRFYISPLVSKSTVLWGRNLLILEFLQGLI
jgi:hypothetical protein